MSIIGTALYKFLASTFGGADWKQGSIVRELVAEPIVGLTDEASAVVNAEYAKLNINTLLEDPTSYSTEIDDLFSELGLSAPTPSQSAGTIRLMLSDYTDIVLTAGTVFSYEDINLRTTAQLKLTLFPAAGDIQIKQIGIDAYEALVPVVSDTTGAALRAGAVLTWSGLPASVYEVSVASAITGGIGAYTPVQKINRIRQQMFPIGLTCAESLLRALNYIQPESAVDCAFAPQSTGGRVKAYVKTTSSPETWKITLSSTQKSGTTRQVVVPSTGIDSLVSIDSVPYSAANVKIEKQPRQWIVEYTGASTPEPLDVTLEVYGLRELQTLQDSLDSFTQGTGITFDLYVPILLDCSVYLPVNKNSLSSAVVNTIVTAINGTGLNTSRVGDALVRPFLTDAGITMLGTGTYSLGRAVTGEARSAQTAANASPFTDNNTPYAIYGYINTVTFNG